MYIFCFALHSRFCLVMWLVPLVTIAHVFTCLWLICRRHANLFIIVLARKMCFIRTSENSIFIVSTKITKILFIFEISLPRVFTQHTQSQRKVQINYLNVDKRSQLFHTKVTFLFLYLGFFLRRVY